MLTKCCNRVCGLKYAVFQLRYSNKMECQSVASLECRVVALLWDPSTPTMQPLTCNNHVTSISTFVYCYCMVARALVYLWNLQWRWQVCTDVQATDDSVSVLTGIAAILV